MSKVKRLSLLGGALFMAAMGIGAPASDALTPQPAVKLRALDKITGKSTDIEVNVEETVIFGGIGLTVRACYQSPPEEQPPESAAYVEIISSRADPKTGVSTEKDPRLFAGWMFASSPGLNAFESPVYDVWVISCKASAPATQ